jgi:hypothetical protein
MYLSASSRVLDRNCLVSAHASNLRKSIIGKSIARFAIAR